MGGFKMRFYDFTANAHTNTIYIYILNIDSIIIISRNCFVEIQQFSRGKEKTCLRNILLHWKLIGILLYLHLDYFYITHEYKITFIFRFPFFFTCNLPEYFHFTLVRNNSLSIYIAENRHSNLIDKPS